MQLDASVDRLRFAASVEATSARWKRAIRCVQATAGSSVPRRFQNGRFSACVTPHGYLGQ